MLQTSRYVEKSRNLEKNDFNRNLTVYCCVTHLHSNWSLQMGQMGPKMTVGALTMSGDNFPGG